MSNIVVSGIVLRSIRYSDNQLILHVYTKLYGRIAVMVRRKAKAGGSNYFQPLFQLNLAINFIEKNSISRATNVSFCVPYQSIPFSVIKSTIVQFLSEILEKVIPEREPDAELYGFLSHSLLLLDRTISGGHMFHLVFLIRLTRYLGVSPGGPSGSNSWFSPSEGTFVSQIMHDTIPQSLANQFEILLKTPISGFADLKFSTETQQELLDYIINFYKVQLNVSNLKSHEILRQVFNH